MQDRQEFIDFILDHYENPRHHGALENPDVVMRGGNPGCGDLVTLYLRLDDSAIVESREVAPGVVLDYNAHNQVVGIELLHLSKRTPKLDLHELLIQTA